MKIRCLFLGLFLLSTTLVSQVTEPQNGRQFNVLLRADLPSDAFTGVVVSEQPNSIKVQLSMQPTRDNPRARKANEPIFKKSEWKTLQVWVLRADGTAVKQSGPPPFSGGTGTQGITYPSMYFSFEHVSPKELSGVVIEIDGKFFVREITSISN